jgi:hypothetical protein
MDPEDRIWEKQLRRKEKEIDKEVGMLTDDDAPNIIEVLKNPGALGEADADLHIECKHEKTAKRTAYYIDGNIVTVNCIYCGVVVRESSH